MILLHGAVLSSITVMAMTISYNRLFNSGIIITFYKWGYKL